MFKSIWERNRT